LRIFSETVHPDRISEILGLAPTETTPRNPESKYRVRRENHLWRWTTLDAIDSQDNLVHLAAIFAKLSGKNQALDELRALGCEIDISNFWDSTGQGGPFLDRATISALNDLGLEIWWDIYFADPSEQEDASESGVVV
jgi:hypothetical protein